jgi:hypothetical protein
LKSETAFLVNFYLPILASLIIFFVALFAPGFLRGLKLPAGETEVSFGLIIVGFKIPLRFLNENVVITKAVCYVISVILLIYALSIDFSKYFPTTLNMDVYYDLNGIHRTLDRLDSEDRAQLNIADDWLVGIGEYDRDVIFNIAKLWDKEGLPNSWPNNLLPRPHFSGSGQTTFVVERLSFFTYKIVESQGRLTYSTTSPRNEVKSFSGASKIKPTASSYIRPTLTRLLSKPSILITPEFMQIFGNGSVRTDVAGVNFDHSLIAATEITLLPTPSIGDTVLLWKAKSGQLIPVAYAIYR